MNERRSRRKVVYLIGAGASHASVKASDCPYGILMTDLNDPLARKIRKLVKSKDSRYFSLRRLVNDLVTQETDYEHIITFLDDSPSLLHRQFAGELRTRFYKVLRKRLDRILTELGDDRFKLYAGLLDMYNVQGCPEKLHGILTINYDDYIEAAANAVLEKPLNFGINLAGIKTSDIGVSLIKLHGSYSWEDTWPIKVTIAEEKGQPLWIPPGIQKAKERYPFNILWGIARDLLQCDVLRIIGCRLGPNDWDLISLLFTTRYSNPSGTTPYVVEVIDSPKRAWELRELFPYLDIRSIVDIDEMRIGQQMVGTLTEGEPQSMGSLSNTARNRVMDATENWFRMWLKQMAESLLEEQIVSSIDTRTMAFSEIMTEY